jgi:phage tail sheath protein FI
MPAYLSPGVYVEEVPSGSAPIAGVSTSVAAFIGVVPDTVDMPPRADVPGAKYMVAPVAVPQLVTHWSEFTRKFGAAPGDAAGVTESNVLARAVRGFFDNGGSRCFVARLTSAAAPADKDPDQVDAALAAFAAIDEISLVAAPLLCDDAVRVKAIQERLLAHCERLGDRVAILDSPREITGDLTASNILKLRSSDYGAYYFPWIDVRGDGAWAPPSGHIAGVYARVDATRGVHKAPANEAIRGSFGVRYRVSKELHDGLNPAGINVIRPFGSTVKIWGARTLADRGQAAQKDFIYINVRRLFAFLRESLQEGTSWVVFEPNTPDLWARITRNVRAFLGTVWQSGALFGATAEEAFVVKCDAENNPAELRALGQVVIEIGVAVTRPAEFVIFRLTQKAGG